VSASREPVAELRLDVGPARALIERILCAWRPLQIWLFGSRARGDAKVDSDWDLLVVVPDDTPDAELEPMAGWRLQKGSGVPADVVACRLSDFREGRMTHNTLAYEVASHGLLVYER
jgi:predicted nucleotidyltransferase